jgi:cell cycle protein kinase DBF2
MTNTSKASDAQYRDIHMDTTKSITIGLRDIHMSSAKGDRGWNDDISMNTTKAATTVKPSGFQLWERELLESSEVKRKATVAQLCASPRDRLR